MFDQHKADAACNFFEGVLKHTVDEWYGKPFALAPWEEQALREIFGNVDEEGNRIIEMVYLEVPKKAGKTEWAAALCVMLLALAATHGFQIYGAAAATRQAMNVYRAACKMVEQSSILKKRLRVLRGTDRILRRSDPDSFYAAVAADGDFGDGVNPAVVIADEVHRWKTRKHIENWDVLTNGGITRRQTLTIAITTAGVQNESPLAWRLHEKTRKVNDGIVVDPKFFGRIYGAAKEDDPASEATWIKANPSLKQNGGFLDISKIREKYVSLVAEGDLTSFKRYFLNMWDQKEGRSIDMALWDKSAGPWKAMGLLPNPGPAVISGVLVEAPKVRPIPDELLGRFIGRKCWVGVDLSMTTDLSAAAFLFPTDDEGFEVLPFAWMPDSNIKARETRDGVPYRAWADAGWLELCPGNVIDYRDIKARLLWGAEMFDVQNICLDPWNSRQLSVPLVDEGYPCVEVRQGFAQLSEPSKTFLALVASGKLHHGGHPVMRWQAGCVSSKEQNDNLLFVKPERSKNSSRIDIISSTVNALAVALTSEPPFVNPTFLVTG